MARQRGQVVLRRIEDRRRRGICFRKRRAGMVKKAEELAVLCDAHVALLVVSPFDGTIHRFSAQATMENIIKRYQNLSAPQKRVHGRSLLKERRSKDFQIPMATTDRSPSNDDMSIDESSISQLTIKQLSRIERKVEYALRKTKARKLDAQRMFTAQEKGSSSSDCINKQQGKGVLEEMDLMKMISREEQDLGRYGTGSQQSGMDVDLMLRLHTGNGCDSGGLRRHEMPININLP